MSGRVWSGSVRVRLVEFGLYVCSSASGATWGMRGK